jgi:hypothetical protein
MSETPHKLWQIAYISTASLKFGMLELKVLLQGSVRRNTEAGITGLLVFKDGCFMQALEGEELAVKALFEKISKDRRHHGIICLINEPIQQRDFPNSAMAFPDLTAKEFRDTPGYSEFLNSHLNEEIWKWDMTKCKRLLLQFKKSFRENSTI